eukprot:3922980-Amphidinium_carterae.2
MVTIPKAKAMANPPMAQFWQRQKGTGSATLQTTRQRTPMPTTSLRTGHTIRNGTTGTIQHHKQKSIRNLYNKSGQTICNSNPTMVLQSTAYMVLDRLAAQQTTMLQRFQMRTGQSVFMHIHRDIFETSGQ